MQSWAKHILYSRSSPVLVLSLPRMQWAEAGLRDDVGQVCVWMLSVDEVEVSLGNVNHLRLHHRQRVNTAGDLSRQLVLHRENVDHHRLNR